MEKHEPSNFGTNCDYLDNVRRSRGHGELCNGRFEWTDFGAGAGGSNKSPDSRCVGRGALGRRGREHVRPRVHIRRSRRSDAKRGRWSLQDKPWKEEVSTKLSPIYLMYAYKRGYERIDTQKEIDRVEAGDNRIFMKPFNGTREERFAYLLSDRPTTGWGRLVLPVFQAIYAELSNLAASQDEMEKARRYAISASNQVLLFMQGSRRHDEFTREIQDFSKENFK